MWTYRPWLVQVNDEQPYYSVFYQGFMPVSTWKQVALHLGIDNIVEYIQFLKQNYPSARFKKLPYVDNSFIGLSIDFADEDDAKNLAEYCNTVAENKGAQNSDGN
jgi:hypothetical protein